MNSSFTSLLVALFLTITGNPPSSNSTPGIRIELLDQNAIVGTPYILPMAIDRGDIIQSWSCRNQQNPDKTTTEGYFETCFDWNEFRQESIGKKDCAVSIITKTANIDLRLAPTHQIAEVRPALPTELDTLYTQIKSLSEQGKPEEGLSIWRQLLPKLSNSKTAASTGYCLGISYMMRDLNPAAITFFESAAQHATHELHKTQSLEALGIAMANAGRIYEAESKLLAARQRRQELHPGSVGEFTLLNGLAAISSQQEDNSKALSFARESLALANERAPGSVAVATTLETIGILEMLQGNLRTAEENFLAGIEILERLSPNSALYSSVLDSLAEVKLRIGDPLSAKTYSQIGAALAARLDNGNLSKASHLYRLGMAEKALGNLSEAESQLEAALELRDQVNGDLSLLSRNLNALGVLMADKGDYESAYDYFARALEIKQVNFPSDHESLAIALINLGSALERRGEFHRAKELYSQALHRALQINQFNKAYIAALIRISKLELTEGNVAIAASLLDPIISAPLQNLDTLPNLKSGIFYTFALLANARADKHNAQKYAKIALAAAEGSETHDLADSLTLLAEVELELGHDPAKATERLVRALAIRERLAPGSDYVAQSLISLARMEARNTKFESALKFYLQAIALIDLHNFRTPSTEEGRARYEERYRTVFHEAVDTALRCNDIEQAFQISERYRAREFLSIAKDRTRQTGPTLAPKTLTDEASRIRSAQSYLLDQIVSSSQRAEAGIKVDQIYRELRRLNDEAGDIGLKIRRSLQPNYHLRPTNNLNSFSIRKHLDPGTLLLSIMIGEKATNIFTLGRDEPLLNVSINIDAPVFTEKTRQYLTLISHHNSRNSLSEIRGAAIEDLSQELCRLLFEQLKDRIERSSRLLILGDGPLHSIPLASLRCQTDRGEKLYLSDWRPIHFALSATAYTEARSTRQIPLDLTADTTRLIAFGGSALSIQESPGQQMSDSEPPSLAANNVKNQPYLHLPALPYSEIETRQIAELFPNSSLLYIGQDATEERLKEIALKADILHIAMHAFADFAVPSSSMVVMSASSVQGSTRDDGLLQAWEIVEQLRLQTDLVVLSACSTGQGPELGGEGVLSLARYFQLAGARTVVSSLWNVSDAATSALMISFYKNLRAGMSKDIALSKAQSEFRNQELATASGAKNPLPYYWAAFQLYGDWQ